MRNEGNWIQLSFKGLTLSRLGRTEEGIDNYLKSIELDPANPFPYNNLGFNYHNLGEYDKALEYYSQIYGMPGL